jgi:hypothetical protein
MIKTYSNTDVVLGNYVSHHSHEIGNKNLMYMRILKSTHEMMATMLHNGVESNVVMSS